MAPIDTRFHLDTAKRSEDWRGYGSLKGMIVPWDMSKDPSGNDRVAKLGTGDHSHAIAHIEFDGEANRPRVGDGFTGKKPSGISAFAVLEPDNWVLRLHEKEGKGKDNVWATRLCVEHDNNSDVRGHRSTIIVDQCDPQNWAWLMDLMWVLNLGATLKDDEIKFDGAGFLPQIKKKGATGSGTRAALFHNVAKNAGFLSDGNKGASYWHLFTILTGKGKSGQTTTAEECGKVRQGDACLRGDVNFDMEGERIHIAVEDAVETEGKKVTGNHWLHEPRPKKPAGEFIKDPKSNQPVINRKLERGLWTWVTIPREPTETENSGNPDRYWPPDRPGVPTPGVGDRPAVPTLSYRNGYTVMKHEKLASKLGTGFYVGTTGIATLPLDIPKGWGMTMDVNIMTPSGGFTGDNILLLAYDVETLGSSVTSAAPHKAANAVVATLNSTNQPGSETVHSVKFHVPYSKISAAKGGKLKWGIYRGSDDDQLDDVDIISKTLFFEDQLQNVNIGKTII